MFYWESFIILQRWSLLLVENLFIIGPFTHSRHFGVSASVLGILRVEKYLSTREKLFFSGVVKSFLVGCLPVEALRLGGSVSTSDMVLISWIAFFSTNFSLLTAEIEFVGCFVFTKNFE